MTKKPSAGNKKIKNYPTKAGVKSTSSLLKKHQSGVIILELPTELYFESNMKTLHGLLQNGYEGLYISFQRPFGNLAQLLPQKGISLKKLLILDVATAFAAEEHQKHARCVHLPPNFAIDDLSRAIYTSLEQIKIKKRFILIDSLTTITLYKPLSEVMRFFEFLQETVEKQQGVLLILNVASELTQKKFIKDIAIAADEVIAV